MERINYDLPRVVEAIHGRRTPARDLPFEAGMSDWLKETHAQSGLFATYDRFRWGAGIFDGVMRRVILRALGMKIGEGVRIEPGVSIMHPETFELGDGVFLGTQSILQGRFDGRCVIGDRTWIGPQTYLDARNLVIGSDVGWGPGAKILGSTHSGVPATVPIIQTDLTILPVRIGDGADIGTAAVILPGVTIGRGAQIGAGAVVTADVADYSVAAGVPARFLRRREGHGAHHE